MRLRDRILSLPWPWWTISACKPFSPWCFLDDLAHALFPMTYGWSSGDLEHWPDHTPWICDRHERATEKWHRKHYPEYFEED